MEIQTSLDIKELTNRYIERSITANSFNQRGAPLELEVNGEKDLWYSLKGGIDQSKSLLGVKKDDISYEIFLNPDKRLWLKVVPPESLTDDHNPVLENRLKLAINIGREAMNIAQLPEFADQYQELLVNIRGKDVLGFLSPHIGPTVKYCLDSALQSKDHEVVADAVSFLSDVYEIGYEQASYLFLEHEYWMEDPNPGNIVIHEKDNRLYVALIDFATAQPIRPYKQIPYEHTKEKRQIRDLEILHMRFAKNCKSNNLHFSETPLEHFRKMFAANFSERNF